VLLTVKPLEEIFVANNPVELVVDVNDDNIIAFGVNDNVDENRIGKFNTADVVGTNDIVPP